MQKLVTCKNLIHSELAGKTPYYAKIPITGLSVNKSQDLAAEQEQTDEFHESVTDESSVSLGKSGSSTFSIWSS